VNAFSSKAIAVSQKRPLDCPGCDLVHDSAFPLCPALTERRTLVRSAVAQVVTEHTEDKGGTHENPEKGIEKHPPDPHYLSGQFALLQQFSHALHITD
jgi:hypothetical protein